MQIIILFVIFYISAIIIINVSIQLTTPKKSQRSTIPNKHYTFVHHQKMKHNASEILLFNQKNRTLQHCSKNTVNTNFLPMIETYYKIHAKIK